MGVNSFAEWSTGSVFCSFDLQISARIGCRLVDLLTVRVSWDRVFRLSVLCKTLEEPTEAAWRSTRPQGYTRHLSRGADLKKRRRGVIFSPSVAPFLVQVEGLTRCRAADAAGPRRHCGWLPRTSATGKAWGDFG